MNSFIDNLKYQNYFYTAGRELLNVSRGLISVNNGSLHTEQQTGARKRKPDSMKNSIVKNKI